MKKIMCVILGLAFLSLGILGITGLVTMFQSDPIYLNIGEIILGSLGFLVGVFARMDVVQASQKAVSAQQANDIERQRHEIDQQRKDIDQQRKELDEQKKENKEKLEVNSTL